MSVRRSTMVHHSSHGSLRVAVTGIGLVTGLGMSREGTWKNMREGRSAARLLNVPAADGAPPYVGFPIPHSEHWCGVQVLIAAIEAMSNAGLLRNSPIDPDRVGTIIGMSKGDLRHLARRHR